MNFTDRLADLGANMLVCETSKWNRSIIQCVDINTRNFNLFKKEADKCGWKMTFHSKARDRDGKMRTVAMFSF